MISFRNTSCLFIVITYEHFGKRQLCASEPEDVKIIRRLIEKALELSIKKVTGHKRMYLVGATLLMENLLAPRLALP
jgi:hypothetical protein